MWYTILLCVALSIIIRSYRKGVPRTATTKIKNVAYDGHCIRIPPTHRLSIIYKKRGICTYIQFSMFYCVLLFFVIIVLCKMAVYVYRKGVVTVYYNTMYMDLQRRRCTPAVRVCGYDTLQTTNYVFDAYNAYTPLHVCGIIFFVCYYTYP